MNTPSIGRKSSAHERVTEWPAGTPSVLRLVAYILKEAGGEMAAAAVAGHAGISVRTIMRALQAFPGFVEASHSPGTPAILSMTPDKLAGVGGQSVRGSCANLGQSDRGSQPLHRRNTRRNQALTDSAELAQNLKTVCLFLNNKQGGTGGEALSTADLEASLPKLVEMTGMDRRAVAERIACAIQFGKHPAGYLQRLLQPGNVLAEYQRKAVRERVDRMLGGTAEAAPVSVRIVDACACGSTRLVSRGACHVQCSECYQTIEGRKREHGEEKGSRGQAHEKENPKAASAAHGGGQRSRPAGVEQ